MGSCWELKLGRAGKGLLGCRPFGDIVKFRAKSSEREENALVLGWYRWLRGRA